MRSIGESAIETGDGSSFSGNAVFALPPSLQNGIARLVLAGDPTAGATALADSSLHTTLAGLDASSAATLDGWARTAAPSAVSTRPSWPVPATSWWTSTIPFRWKTFTCTMRRR